VHRVFERHRKLETLPLLWVALVLVLVVQGDGLAGIKNGSAVEPAPRLMASGIGVSMCAASYSLFSDLSRATAQPAVLITSTSSPYFS